MATSKKISDNIDEESRTVLYRGANLSQLGILFQMDHRVLVEKLHGVPHDDENNRAKLWKVSTVAPYLVKPIYDIEKYILKMNHTELPKMLSKEYWAGARSKQEWEIKNGDLWPTAQVVENVGAILQIFKMSARLFIDAVDSQSQLTEKQRMILKGLVDGMLTECSLTMQEKFKDIPAPKQDDDEI